MHLPTHMAMESWKFPIVHTLILVFAASIYLRGWLHLRVASANILPVWRAASFLVGLFLIWVALEAPLAGLDGELLTIHMVQHLLLMTFAPALILLGAPVLPLWHALPERFRTVTPGRIFRWSPLQHLGRLLSHPVFCWIASTTTLIGWHIPSIFTLGLQSEAWHMIEHGSFLGAGFLFWWPVVQPWPSVAVWPRWTILLYLFLATLPCDILSAFLVFSDRVAYPVYLSAEKQFNITVLQDQQLAGALMWTCVTITYLFPATILSMRLLRTPTSLTEESQSWELLMLDREISRKY